MHVNLHLYISFILPPTALFALSAATCNKFVPYTGNVYSLSESSLRHTNEKLDLLLADSRAEGYHEIPALLPFLLLAYPYTMEVYVDGSHARSPKVIHFNMLVNALFPSMGNGQPLKSATTLDCSKKRSCFIQWPWLTPFK